MVNLKTPTVILRILQLGISAYNTHFIQCNFTKRQSSIGFFYRPKSGFTRGVMKLRLLLETETKTFGDKDANNGSK
jgi:hypothetical protein